MSRRERRTRIGAQFAPRRIDMLESAAWRVLSLSARRLLDRLDIEMAHHGGTGNGKLPCTYADFERYGIERHAIGPAIREACALGLLVVTEHGCAGNAEYRSPNLFRLTYRHAPGFPGDGTHDWQRIATTEQAMSLARAARQSKSPPANPQWGKKPKASAGNPHRKPKIPVRETPTTGQGGETPTTIDMSDGARPGPRATAISDFPDLPSFLDRRAH